MKELNFGQFIFDGVGEDVLSSVNVVISDMLKSDEARALPERSKTNLIQQVITVGITLGMIDKRIEKQESEIIERTNALDREKSEHVKKLEHELVQKSEMLTRANQALEENRRVLKNNQAKVDLNLIKLELHYMMLRKKLHS